MPSAGRGYQQSAVAVPRAGREADGAVGDAAALVHGLVLAGGQGMRLGGVSKADLDVGERLLDLVLRALFPHVSGTTVVVAPAEVCVPVGVERTMEQPPGGGPLAGIGAGLELLPAPRKSPGEGGDGSCGNTDGGRRGGTPRLGPELVIVCGVDTPGLAGLVGPLLQEALAAVRMGADGAVVHGGAPEPFDQHLQAVYEIGALRSAIADVRGGLHGKGVRGILGRLELVRLHVNHEVCQDLDTPEDLQFWRKRLGWRPR